MPEALPNRAPLRVVHLNSLLTGGGTDEQAVRVAHALRQLGHAVVMVGPADREYSAIAQKLGLPLQATAPGFLKLRFILATVRCVRRQGIQILHAHHGRDYWPAVLAARLSDVRPIVVLSRHLAKSPGSWLSRRFLLGQCDAIVAVSEFVAKVLREGDADPGSDNPERHWRPPMRGDLTKIHVVYGGLNLERFVPADTTEQRQAWGLSPRHHAFAVVGAYDLPRGKGQSEFLRAAARIQTEVPRARFLVVGRGNMKDILEADIQRLGLQGRAWLTPYCQDMPAAMNAMDCMVHPQVGTESWGAVVCEAHACGKPVIASDLDGIPEAFAAGGYGQLVQRGSIEELAAAMKAWAARLPLDLAARQRLHEKVAAQFSLERAAQNLAALYQSLLAGPASGKLQPV